MTTQFAERAKEYVRKEERARLNFFIKNHDLLQLHATCRKTKKCYKLEEEYKDLKEKCKCLIPNCDCKNKVTCQKPCKPKCTPSYEKLFQGIHPCSWTNTMRPVQHRHCHILYTDNNLLGRRTYLKERSKFIPEDRYYFKQTTTMDYGWKLPKTVCLPRYACRYALDRDSWRQNGLAMFQKDEYYPCPRLLPLLCNPCL